MADEQPKLLNGPVFDFGPGWGFYVKRWLGKYLFKIVLPAIVVIAALGLYIFRDGAESNEKTAVNDKIAVVVVRGDSRTHLARKALAEYLKNYPEEPLSGGQKLFIEEILRRKLANPKLTIGEIAEFAVDDIKAVIAQAKQLTPFQLEVWEKYAKGIKF